MKGNDITKALFEEAANYMIDAIDEEIRPQLNNEVRLGDFKIKFNLGGKKKKDVKR